MAPTEGRPGERHPPKRSPAGFTLLCPRCHARIVDPKHGPPQDRDRCPELHEVGRCQLVRGHEGQHVIRYGSATIGWPDGEQRPTQWLPWAPTFPRDER